jgi:hypothetical protein
VDNQLVEAVVALADAFRHRVLRDRVDGDGFEPI